MMISNHTDEDSDRHADRDAESLTRAELHADSGPLAAEADPITLGLMGKFFGVPLLIIGTIVGGAVLVVLLFGGPAAPERRSIASLVQALEAGSGHRTIGLLLPREKELWQTALELSIRLDKNQQTQELTDAELRLLSERLGALVRVDLGNLDRLVASGEERADQRAIRSRRLEFLIHALGRTGRPEAVPYLIEVVQSESEACSAVAMQELANLEGLAEVRRAVPEVLAVLKRSTQPETRLIACTVLSVLGSGSDQDVIDALSSVRLSADGEVEWSAALALARLGSNAGKSTLLDLLDRRFLESGKLYQVTDGSGVVHRYPLPPGRVDEVLLAAIDAASNLRDTGLWVMIETLSTDKSPTVRERASAALKNRTGEQT